MIEGSFERCVGLTWMGSVASCDWAMCNVMLCGVASLVLLLLCPWLLERNWSGEQEGLCDCCCQVQIHEDIYFQGVAAWPETLMVRRYLMLS